jgi:hypothetical protein
MRWIAAPGRSVTDGFGMKQGVRALRMSRGRLFERQRCRRNGRAGRIACDATAPRLHPGDVIARGVYGGCDTAYSEFVKQVESGNVSEIFAHGQSTQGALKEAKPVPGDEKKGTYQRFATERPVLARDDLGAFGGLAAEELVLGVVSTGAETPSRRRSSSTRRSTRWARIAPRAFPARSARRAKRPPPGSGSLMGVS